MIGAPSRRHPFGSATVANSDREAAVTPGARAFTLLELLVVVALVAVLMALVGPAFNSIQGGGALTKAVNDVSGIFELARAEAMATRSYVYVGFANTTNSDGNSELRIGAVISIDGSSSTAATNLRPISRLSKMPSVVMTNYTNLPPSVQSAADQSLRDNNDYVVGFPTTAYLRGHFNDTAFDNCPTVAVSPQGEILHATNPGVFFRTTSSVGLVPTRGTTRVANDGAIVSYYGGTGQLRITRQR